MHIVPIKTWLFLKTCWRFTLRRFIFKLFCLQCIMSLEMSATVRNRKSKNIDDLETTSPIQQSAKLLDQLFQARLIDKISRPIDKKVKEEYIDQYNYKLNLLHENLCKIHSEVTQKSTTDGNTGKNRSMFGSITHKPNEWSKYIRNIQSKYTEVLIEGSYKYLNRICTLLSLRYDSVRMQPINIQLWANSCLENKTANSCC